ncbi:MFS multidrug transporter [Botrytis cinerea]
MQAMSTPPSSNPNSPSTNPPNETSPLISTHNHPHELPSPSPPSPPSASLPTLILYFMALHFLIAFCEMVLVAPLISLFESSLCHSYYNFPSPSLSSKLNTQEITSEMCKIPEIQGPLATIRGWKSFGDTIPGAYPKIFDLRWVWLSSLFLLCGGGLYSSAAFMWAMASSLIPEVERSYAFYYIFSAFYIAELIGSYVASITIDVSPWIACSMAMGSVILGLILLWLVPFSQSSPRLELLSPSTSSPSSSTRLRSRNLKTTPKTTILATIRHAVIQPNVLLCIPVFLVGTLRYTTLNVLIQYSSVRFNTKISKGAMFYTETAIINIILFLFLIPRITVWIKSRYHVRSEKIDLALMRISVCFLLMGSLAIGLAPTSGWIPAGVSIFAAGFGSRVSTLSLISHFIPASSLATLYASIAVLENLGHAINDPSMQHIFAATLRLPPVWHALPFFVAAICYFLAGLSTIFIKIDIDGMKLDDEGQEEDS